MSAAISCVPTNVGAIRPSWTASLSQNRRSERCFILLWCYKCTSLKSSKLKMRIMTHVLRYKQLVGTKARYHTFDWDKAWWDQGYGCYSESAVHCNLKTESEMVTTQRVEFPSHRDSSSSVLTSVPPSSTWTTSAIRNDHTQAHIISCHVRPWGEKGKKDEGKEIRAHNISKWQQTQAWESQGMNLHEFAGWVSIPITWAYFKLWYGRKWTCWHKVKPKIGQFLEILQGLQEIMKWGVMGMKPAQFNMPATKPWWVTDSP